MRREVLDYQMVWDKSPAALAAWAKSLPAGWVPIALGQQSGPPDPPLVHAVAAKLSGPPVWVKLDSGNPSHSALGLLQRLVVGGERSLDLIADRASGVAFDGGTDAVIEARRAAKARPVWLSDGGRVGWRADGRGADWDIVDTSTPDEMWAAVADAAGRNRYLSGLAATRAADGTPRLRMAATGRPDPRDWWFKDYTSIEEAAADITRRQAEGLVPVALTSHAPHKNLAHPYLLAWVRGRARPPAPAAASPELPPAPAGTHPDLAAHLPLTDNEPRRVTDFAVALDRSPDEAARWAAALGPGFVTVAVGANATSPPARVHAVAVRLADAPPRNQLTYTWQPYPNRLTDRPASVRPLAKLLVHPHPGEFREFEVLADDPPGWYWMYWVATDQLQAEAESLTRDKAKPHVLWHDPYRRGQEWAIHKMATSLPTATRLAADLDAAKLAAYVAESRRDGFLVTHVVAYVNRAAQVRYGVLLHGNPDGHAARFHADLPRADFLAKLAAYKADGFFPLAITSSGDGAGERWAASWVRFVVP